MTGTNAPRTIAEADVETEEGFILPARTLMLWPWCFYFCDGAWISISIERQAHVTLCAMGHINSKDKFLPIGVQQDVALWSLVFVFLVVRLGSSCSDAVYQQVLTNGAINATYILWGSRPNEVLQLTMDLSHVCIYVANIQSRVSRRSSFQLSSFRLHHMLTAVMEHGTNGIAFNVFNQRQSQCEESHCNNPPVDS